MESILFIEAIEQGRILVVDELDSSIHFKLTMEKYRKGALGALPDPELINSLLSMKGNTKGIM